MWTGVVVVVCDERQIQCGSRLASQPERVNGILLNRSGVLEIDWSLRYFGRIGGLFVIRELG